MNRKNNFPLDSSGKLSFELSKITEKLYKEAGYKRISPIPLLKRYGFWIKKDRMWMFKYGNDFMHNVFDHCKAYEFKGIKFLIGEPYGIHLETLKKLITHCEENNLYCHIDGRSIHFPNRTIWISINEKKDEQFKI